MFRAYIEGYQEHLFDMECMAVQQGYWAGYFQSKKPKPANAILKKMEQDHRKAKRQAKNAGKNIPKPAVDVESFLQREERRKAFLARKNKR